MTPGKTLFDFDASYAMEGAILDALCTACVSLSKCQRCDYWFLLRRFTLRATTAARVLKTDLFFRPHLQLDAFTEPERTPAEWMQELANSSFFTHRGTDDMTRESLNEDAVTTALLGVPCFMHIATVGLISRREERYVAASADGIAAVDMDMVAEATCWTVDKTIALEGKNLR